MAIKQTIEELNEKFSDFTMTKVGKIFKTTALILAISASAMNPATVSANSVDSNSDYSVSALQSNANEFNALYSKSDQLLILGAGNFINKMTNRENSTFLHAVKTIEKMKDGMINENPDMNRFNFDSADLSKMIIKKYAKNDTKKIIDELPQFMRVAAKSVIPEMNEIKPEDQKYVIAKADMLETDEWTINNFEESYNLVTNSFRAKMIEHGGVDIGSLKNGTFDVSFKPSDVKTGFSSYMKQGVENTLRATVVTFKGASPKHK